MEVIVSGYNITTPLGFTARENAAAMSAAMTSITEHHDTALSPGKFYASIFDDGQLEERFSRLNPGEGHTRLEKLALLSISSALHSHAKIGDRSLFILSTTKGNVDLLKTDPSSPRLYLWNTARLIADYFGFRNRPLVVSQACISGIQALMTGTRLIRAGLYDTVVINGTDIISEFVLSGFNSFKSLSTGPCRPFDISRDGLSLGEGSGTIILRGVKDPEPGLIAVGEGFSMNDANHISGPSRTGEGLYLAISRVIGKTGNSFDYISAHGTATAYNDEMEAVAINRAGLQDVPVNSLKGYWGHTLGAAGVIESAMTVYCMENSLLLNTMGFRESGVTLPLNIISSAMQMDLKKTLKLGSGFGGCNAALPFYTT